MRKTTKIGKIGGTTTTTGNSTEITTTEAEKKGPGTDRKLTTAGGMVGKAKCRAKVIGIIESGGGMSGKAAGGSRGSERAGGGSRGSAEVIISKDERIYNFKFIIEYLSLQASAAAE